MLCKPGFFSTSLTFPKKSVFERMQETVFGCFFLTYDEMIDVQGCSKRLVVGEVASIDFHAHSVCYHQRAKFEIHVFEKPCQRNSLAERNNA